MFCDTKRQSNDAENEKKKLGIICNNKAAEEREGNHIRLVLPRLCMDCECICANGQLYLFRLHKHDVTTNLLTMETIRSATHSFASNRIGDAMERKRKYTHTVYTGDDPAVVRNCNTVFVCGICPTDNNNVIMHSHSVSSSAHLICT